MAIGKQESSISPLFITGLTRSGKTLAAPIIASLDGVEKVNVSYEFEFIPMLRYSDSISLESAIAAMRFILENKIYENEIGRNINFRLGDWTSVWNYSDPKFYIDRLSAQEGDIAFRKLEESDGIFQLLVHDALWHAELYFSAFPNSRMLQISRHPVDLIDSWFVKGYGGDFYQNPRNALLTIHWNENVLPYYALGWEEEYLKLSELERIVRTVETLQTKELGVYGSLSEERKTRVKFVKFERLAEYPQQILTDWVQWIGKKQTEQTFGTMTKENVPRKIDISNRKATLAKMENQIGKESYNVLLNLIDRYESIC